MLAKECRRLADQAVTEGVNLRYVEQMRQKLYAAAALLVEMDMNIRELYEAGTLLVSYVAPARTEGEMDALAKWNAAAAFVTFLGPDPKPGKK